MVSDKGKQPAGKSSGKRKLDDDKIGANRKRKNRGVLQFFDDAAGVSDGEYSSGDSIFDDGISPPCFSVYMLRQSPNLHFGVFIFSAINWALRTFRVLMLEKTEFPADPSVNLCSYSVFPASTPSGYSGKGDDLMFG